MCDHGRAAALPWRSQTVPSAAPGGVRSLRLRPYPWPKGEMKYRQQCTLLSWMFLRFRPLSSRKYCSNCWSMYSATGFQLRQGQTSRETVGVGAASGALGLQSSPRPGQGPQGSVSPWLAFPHLQGGTWARRGCISPVPLENPTKHTGQVQ